MYVATDGDGFSTPGPGLLFIKGYRAEEEITGGLAPNYSHC